MGITPIIDFISENYDRAYAPNTRETIRDDVVKHFLASGLLVRNPDEPGRPTNSGKTVYQIEPSALELIRVFGSIEWSMRLESYMASLEMVRGELERFRVMQRVPVTLPSGERISLSPGGQNPLVKLIIEEFCPRFTPGGAVLYVGDTETKFEHFEKEYFLQLGIEIAHPDKMPDVVVHLPEKAWLVLVEAVTTAGPVDGKRRMELKRLFSHSEAGLIFVSAFVNRSSFRGFLSQISWETEVWIADSPDHMIHFNGERFLGPYEDALPVQSA